MENSMKEFMKFAVKAIIAGAALLSSLVLYDGYNSRIVRISDFPVSISIDSSLVMSHWFDLEPHEHAAVLDADNLIRH